MATAAQHCKKCIMFNFISKTKSKKLIQQNMASTTQQHCKKCGVALIEGSKTEICPECNNVGHNNQTLMSSLFLGVGPSKNGASSQHQDGNQNKAAYLSPQFHWSRKKAVLCGVTYNGHKKKLESSFYSVISMHQLLVEKMGFKDSSIVILSEEESDPDRIPTKRNIQTALASLVNGCQYGDLLFFYYTGHASQMPGYASAALCPLDFEVSGMILNDEINATIVAPLTRGVNLVSVIDSDFSGTMLDLPYNYRMDINGNGLYIWEIHDETKKPAKGGKAVCTSACEEYQKRVYTKDPYAGFLTMGALTYSFIQVMKTADAKLTYRD
ncbi:metacaspase-3-like [Rutidosis leptorrhynchoides]|uniref:metacaspase-3-like n=1 Tax=Rutidosis leptorrhynchoides TaxID=125765 RepID=UPI003A99657F